MKDAPHHLKHIQKKVLQSVRREQNLEVKSVNHTESPSKQKEEAFVDVKRADTNHRVPRIPVRSSVH